MRSLPGRFHWSGSGNPPDDGISDASDCLVTAGSADHVFNFLHQVEGKKQNPNDLAPGSDGQRPPGADLAVYSFRTRTLPPAVCAQWPKTVTGARYCMFFLYSAGEQIFFHSISFESNFKLFSLITWFVFNLILFVITSFDSPWRALSNVFWV
jgi:hypothetical protein